MADAVQAEAPGRDKEEKKRLKEEAKQKKEDEKAAKKAALEATQAAARAGVPVPQLTQKDVDSSPYGQLFIQSASTTRRTWTPVKDLTPTLGEQHVWLVCRVSNSRKQGNKLCFLTLRQTVHSVQAVVAGKDMATFAGSLGKESMVHVFGKVVLPQEPIASCSQSTVEIAVERIYCTSAAETLPFQLEDASRPQADYEADPTLVKVNQETRLDNRVIDLRTATSQSILRITSGTCTFFRNFLLGEGFVEIHTPKLIASASEGGADVFRLEYFEGSAYLAQSPQLYKQMALMTDLGRVFEIGPVFRSEKSMTHRHMTEFTGLDMEMTFVEHYHEVLEMLEKLFCHIFDGLNRDFKPELESVRKQFPFEDLKYSFPPLRMTFAEAVALLKEHGPAMVKEDLAAATGAETPEAAEEVKRLTNHLASIEAHVPTGDIGTEDERLLGRIMNKHKGQDFYVVDKFPANLRPFYTMEDAENPELGNAYDIFIRGEEVTSGAQRVHDPQMLLDRAKSLNVDLGPLQSYVDAFKYGAPPHAGGGIGMERVVMLFMGLNNIRKTSMFPRDPKRLTP